MGLDASYAHAAHGESECLDYNDTCHVLDHCGAVLCQSRDWSWSVVLRVEQGEDEWQ